MFKKAWMLCIIPFSIGVYAEPQHILRYSESNSKISDMDTVEYKYTNDGRAYTEVVYKEGIVERRFTNKYKSIETNISKDDTIIGARLEEASSLGKNEKYAKINLIRSKKALGGDLYYGVSYDDYVAKGAQNLNEESLSVLIEHEKELPVKNAEVSVTNTIEVGVKKVKNYLLSELSRDNWSAYNIKLDIVKKMGDYILTAHLGAQKAYGDIPYVKRYFSSNSVNDFFRSIKSSPDSIYAGFKVAAPVKEIYNSIYVEPYFGYDAEYEVGGSSKTLMNTGFVGVKGKVSEDTTIGLGYEMIFNENKVNDMDHRVVLYVNHVYKK